ncbi:uncharacterized protein PHALS_02039 [Plasmopara halstedii]|uniref:Uncharacterized protein n=1 Tax=Plasmopara halstedii TaxID=4781 RepID=A0A0P1AX61_PLAHL|nr:uncharacterized protein PHALS_02039 [Plasmopara halstedii]CEG45764.1 hypothetical protein PHALS_02039 [Plasmopara halstedii]|eukprot:XP_024582133.1 hypothetical protein PHALS_02039 [Plasmopara halstedii]
MVRINQYTSSNIFPSHQGKKYVKFVKKLRPHSIINNNARKAERNYEGMPATKLKHNASFV